MKYEELGKENFIPTNLKLGSAFDFIFDSSNKLSINLEFNETAFKYWKSSEDESYGFPVRFTKEFDRKTKLNICTVTITKLLPGQAYKFVITATAKEQKFRLELGEFEVPQVPYVSTQGVNTYFGSVSHGAPVPIGGGGERRWMQF